MSLRGRTRTRQGSPSWAFSLERHWSEIQRPYIKVHKYRASGVVTEIVDHGRLRRAETGIHFHDEPLGTTEQLAEHRRDACAPFKKSKNELPLV